MSERIGSTVIENVRPQLDAGRWPVKRVEGDTLTVKADIFKEGHDILVAVVRWRQSAPKEQVTEWAEVPMAAKGNDLLGGRVPPRAQRPLRVHRGGLAGPLRHLGHRAQAQGGRGPRRAQRAARGRRHAAGATPSAPRRPAAPTTPDASPRPRPVFDKGMSPDAIATAMDPGLTADRPPGTRTAPWPPGTTACSRSSWTASGRSSAPGTSSSRARRRATAAPTAPSGTRRSWLPYVAVAGLRRHLPAAHPPHRPHGAQGQEQQPHRRAPRTWAAPGPSAPPRAATRPCTRSSARSRTSGASSRRPTRWASRSRWTSPTSARRTTPT